MRGRFHLAKVRRVRLVALLRARVWFLRKKVKEFTTKLTTLIL